MQEFAHHGVAILVCHHTRKAVGEDFVDDVAGTNGLAGSADVVMSLRRARGQADAVLHLTSREAEEREIGLTRFGPCWQM
ncbi:hypothetical protein [Streptomyces sp. SID13031]|uniref:hypothetical protein n=1 Tax=Streptomyces sp. SID13031 TaxID=2706046 RepID=UPI0013C565B0|nr:hypothetical protein [Streptomyces sp. SID13031]NEA37302.1 hypothetical protein [Streptomyces sp. SID13031]